MGVTVELLQVGSARHRGRLVGLPTREHVDFPISVALIRHPRRGFILFDTGYGSSVMQSRGLGLAAYRRLLSAALPDHQRIDIQLIGRGIAPDQIGTILLSHGHADHIGGLADVPARPTLWSRATREDFCTGTTLSRAVRGVFASLLPPDLAARAALLEECPTIDPSKLLPGFGTGYDLFADGSLIGIPLPGHARGQFGLLCQVENGRPIFLVADAAWVRENITDAAEPSRLLDLVVDDAKAYRQTLTQLRRLHAQRPDIVFAPSHCPSALRRLSLG